MLEATTAQPTLLGQATTDAFGRFSIRSPKNTSSSIFYASADVGGGVEFLTVLGNLTAEILTPELHAMLSKVALGAEKGAPSKPMNPAHTEEEDTRS